MPGVLLGIDGGGTSTTCWLADETGTPIGRARVGPSNARVLGNERAEAALEAAVDAAFENANLTRCAVRSACFGLAGFDRPEERALLQRWNTEHGWAERFLAANDAELVLAAGTPGWGIALISGTGSIAYGRTPDGRTARAGGWGPLLGDEGSGYAVTLAALRLVARRADGRSSVPRRETLTAAALMLTGASTPADLVATLYTKEWDRARLASLAPGLATAAAHDPDAIRQVVGLHAEALVELARTVAMTLDLADHPLPLALAGGFLLAPGPFQDAVRVTLSFWKHDLDLTEVFEPVAGAIALARSALS